MGQSGVGKSSLLNAINGDYKRNIGEYSKALGRGKHKTKEVILSGDSEGNNYGTVEWESIELYKDYVILYPYNEYITID